MDGILCQNNDIINTNYIYSNVLNVLCGIFACNYIGY